MISFLITLFSVLGYAVLAVLTMDAYFLCSEYLHPRSPMRHYKWTPDRDVGAFAAMFWPFLWIMVAMFLPLYLLWQLVQKSAIWLHKKIRPLIFKNAASNFTYADDDYD